MIKNIEIALRGLLKRGRSNGIKILSLGVGLAMGLVLIAKIYFEQSYDNFYPDTDRIYLIQTEVSRGDEEDKTFGQVSGAIAPGMKAEIPQVEAAMRYTSMGANDVIYTTDKRRFKVDLVIAADSCLFQFFPRPMLAGNAAETLSRPNYVIIARSLAEKMGGVDAVINTTFERDRMPGKPITIGGVFEDVPENATARYDIICSLNTIPEWSLTNWMGNDRYRAFVKLTPGTDPQSLAGAIRQMQARNQDIEAMKKAGVDMTYSLLPLEKIHNDHKEVKDMNRMIGFLALILILTAVLNYILIVVSTLVGRTKEIAVHKCYGASGYNIFGMIITESILHLLLSLTLATLLIFAFRGTIQDLLSVSIGALFTLQTLPLVLAISLVVLAITALVPTFLYIYIPVAYAFRNAVESKRFWKLALLFLQFMATAYLVVLLLITNRQYNMMITDDPGYDYKNLLYVSTAGVDSTARAMAVDELHRLTEIKVISSCYTLPITFQSGNNIFLPNDDRELFNIADMYQVSDGYFETMNIPVIEGEVFPSNSSSKDKIMVSRSFVEKMQTVAGWSGSPIGKGVIVTEHSQSNDQFFTICGVYEDFLINSMVNPDKRPSVFFYTQKPSHILLIKLNRYDAATVEKITRTLTTAMPNKDIQVMNFESEMVSKYIDARRFRDSILLGGIVTLIIALIGLLGYTTDEINRRGREIAIRKINGATAREILQMVSADVSRIALPALAIGVMVAAWSGEEWMQKFSEKVSLSVWIYIGGGVAVLTIILLCVMLRAWKVSRTNPTEALKNE